MKNNFIVGATMLVTSVLAPTVWHLWIYNNSANANFYFGVTLIFCTAQVNSMHGGQLYSGMFLTITIMLFFH